MIDLNALRVVLDGPLAPLKQYKQFVLWELAQTSIEKKPRKVSCNARGAWCNAHDSSNWLTADEALSLANGYGNRFGVAFVFTDNDPFVFIDVDNCYVDGNWTAPFHDVYGRFGAGMFEVSQSLTGAHFFVSGNVPNGFRGTKYGGFECYRTKRFVALTGISAQGSWLDFGDTLQQFIIEKFPKWHADSVELSYDWSTSACIEAGNVPDDDEVLRQFLDAPPHLTPEHKFAKIFPHIAKDINAPVSNADLFNANAPVLIQTFPPDKNEPFDMSRAGYALACRLARYTGKNCEQTLRLMNRAAFRRGRADEQHDNECTYMQWDVKRACGFITVDMVKRWGGPSVTQVAVVDAAPTVVQLPDASRFEAIKRHREAFNDAGTREELELAAAHCKADSSLTPIDRETLAQELQKCFEMKNEGKPRIALVRLMLTPERTFEAGDNFTRDGNGLIERSQTNVNAAVRKLPAQLRFDTFTGRIIMGDTPLDEVDYTRVIVFVESLKVPPPTLNQVRLAVEAVAHENQFDSAQDWLKSLQWDGIERVETSLLRLFGLDDNAYHRSVGRYMWTAMAGRVMQPGVKADAIPVFVSEEGFAKTSFVESIVPRPEFYGLLSMDTKRDDIARRIKGKLVMEWGELDGLKTRERTAVLNFLTQRNEQYVEKWEKIETYYSRRMMVIATTNDDTFLDAHAAERRMLPIRCDRHPCLLDVLKVERDQLWAEAAVRFQLYGVEWQYAQEYAPDVRDTFREVDPLESVLEQFFRQSPGVVFGGYAPNPNVTPEQRWKMSDIVAYVTKANVVRSRINQQSVAKLLRSMGYERVKSSGNFYWYKSKGAAGS